jgi:hypothetical protein
MSIKTQKFGGLEISVSGFNDGLSRVRDIDLGEWLELSRPRNIRKEIKKLLSDKFLNDYDVRSIRERTQKIGIAERTVTEYWLTEQAALFVVARSDQPKGVLALKMLITVFDEFRSANKKASRLLELVFRDTPIPNHKKRLFCPLAVQLSKFIAPSEWDGTGAPPIWIKSIAQHIYRWALPADDEQSKRRELNMSPGRASVDYNWLTTDGEAALVDVLKAGEILASASQSYLHWRNLMENRYMDKALQLELLIDRRRLVEDK